MLMFVGKVCGKTEEAVNFYTSVFKNSPAGAKATADTKANVLARYGKGEEPDKEGTVRYAAFTLLGQEFGAMDSGREHQFAFNEALSFMVLCENQEEIDYFWGKLSADPQVEQCGCLKDRYALPGQITLTIMNKMLAVKEEERIARVTQAFRKMKKFNIDHLTKRGQTRLGKRACRLRKNGRLRPLRMATFTSAAECRSRTPSFRKMFDR